jgi:chemotaxis signal transduction protein
VALLVDDAEGIVQIAEEALRRAPTGSDGSGMLEGVARDAAGLMNVVRVDALVERLLAKGAGEAQ